MSQNRTVSLSVQRVLAMSAAVAGGLALNHAEAQDQAAGAGASQSATDLQEVVVTGSRVRRVDTETASPVFVMDSKTIEQSGASTVGDLVNRIPAIAGAGVTPAVNNGGGFGESNIELRGLGVQRTLILIDGQRVNLVGNSLGVDVNQIPLNEIDHVDVLKEGAGAIYGSDAIAGVVNFITKKDMDGVTLTGDWGRTSKNDGEHYDGGITFGTHTDKAHFLVGGYYNKQKEVSQGNREWSKYALYLYSGSLNKAGSTTVPGGRIQLPANLAAQYGCPRVTKIAGTNGSTLADYRCYVSGADAFNFQPYNLDLTPQERGTLFAKAFYDINDNVTAYTHVIYNHTHSGFQLAPYPFVSNNENVTISGQSIYNPFGVDFGGGPGNGGINPNAQWRLTGNGDRQSDSTSASLITRTGIKGKLWSTPWQYDLGLSYNRLDQDQTVHGYLFNALLNQAVGPSFYAGPGNTNPTCGTTAAPIANCTPINIFDQEDLPGVFNTASAYYSTTNTFVSKTANLDFNGPLFKLPGGDMQGAVGFDYTDLRGQFQTSAITVSQPPDYLSCQLAQETCSGNSVGQYNFKEVYGELFMPLLADIPGIYQLNLDGGVRYSRYSLFGSTTRGSVKLEYRPIRDLLIRGTFAQIFRAPTVNDISAAPASNAPSVNDLCNGYRGQPSAQFPQLAAACQGVPTDGSYQATNNQVTGIITSNPNLKPETGDVKTFGMVYDPSFSVLNGLSLSADYWTYYVKDLITTLDTQYAINQCATTGAQQFCSLIHRYPSGPNAGQIISFSQPTFNLGTLNTDGVDFSLHYNLKGTKLGDWGLYIDETHVMSYTNTPAPGAAVQQLAGTYDKQFGFFAKDRATASFTWGGWGAQGMLTARYIGPVQIPQTNGYFNADGSFSHYGGDHLGGVTYFDLTVGYLIKRTNTELRAGALNIGDKIPPISGSNSFAPGFGIYDPTVYDSVGRRFFVGFTQNF